MNAAGFAALGHPARLGILRRIVQGPETGTAVGEIQEALDIPASTLSHHLATLSAAGLVSVARQGTFLFYRAHFQNLHGLTDYLWQDCCAAGSGPAPAKGPCPTGPSLDVETD